ncbi:hypothetical protein SY85_24230 [Flavisolibacter tropicus]|uniref:Uncharacterized protein n=2 Tax=Flavisolibacter tropicus TaxID=1492898 RepID=A0A172U1I1_9BACT|nr:hypothetical protein SY85_24230 [Flavisolibacter tropicus]
MIMRPLLILLFLFSVSLLYGQVKGCKDPAANNYNPNATISDGSCLYNYSFYNPTLKVNPLAETLVETSDLQWDGKNLWTFNDDGAAAIYKIDTLTNTIWQTVYLEGATNINWEDMAFDGTYFYIGDFGNNNGGRKDLKIYKFPATAIPDHSAAPSITIPASAIEVIQFTYADQPQPIVPTEMQKTPFDCEAMIVDEDGIHLFTKDWLNKTTTHYRINSTHAGTFSAQPFETFPANLLVTGADKIKGTAVIVLIGYNNTGLGPHYLYILSDYNNGKFFNGNKRKIELPNATVIGQAEGITFRNQTYGYVSNEQFSINIGPTTFTISPKLWSFDLTQFIPAYALPIKLKDFSAIEAQDINQLIWQFEDTVSLLTVEYSSDGINFRDVFKIKNTVHGSFSHKTDKLENYYRLKWQDDNGQIGYSKVIKAKTSIIGAISNLSLTASGELKFTITGSTSLTAGFKVTAIDGKLISEIPIQTFLPGKHAVSFKNSPIATTALLVTSFNLNGQRTWLLSIH